MTLSIRQITAEHEAAHAVAYLALDYPIHRVEIEPEGLTLSTPRPTLRPLRDTAIVTAAGLVIEARYSVIPVAEQLEETVTLVDGGWAANELGDLGFFAEHQWLLDSSVREAESLLAEHHDYHRKVTDALLSHGFLTAHTVPPFAH